LGIFLLLKKKWLRDVYENNRKSLDEMSRLWAENDVAL